jgi:hypothetical protein
MMPGKISESINGIEKMPVANHHFELAERSGIIVSHQVFVKPKIERLRISSHLKVA